jgi:general secretion pathway protein A
MYESFYGLQERPFDLTANPRFLFLSSGHREALSTLQYGIEANKGITLLVGEAGTGKTTLIRAAIERARGGNSLLVYLSNPTLTRAEFYDFLASGFGLSREAGQSKPLFLRELERSLLVRRERGGISALIVDEAQSVPYELLEEIRLLSNLETATVKLLPVVLTGQPELADRLNEVSLRQLKQRVALRAHLPPFDLRETAAYIAKRIRIAGGDSAAVFTREAVEAIQRGSSGIARTISVVCDNALISGFALQRTPVDADVVLEVCRDFDLLHDTDGHDRAGRIAPAAQSAQAGQAPATGRQASAAGMGIGASGSGGSSASQGPASPVPGPGRPGAANARPVSPGGVELRPVPPVRPDDRLKTFDRPTDGRRLDPQAETRDDQPATRRRRFIFF